MLQVTIGSARSVETDAATGKADARLQVLLSTSFRDHRLWENRKDLCATGRKESRRSVVERASTNGLSGE